MSPTSLSPFYVLAQLPLARLSSTSIRSTPMHRYTLFFIFMDLWKCRLPSIIVPRTIAYSFSALHASVSATDSIHVFIVSTILKVVETDWPAVAQKPMASCFGCGSLVARCLEPGRGRCNQEQGWSRAPRGRRGPSRNCYCPTCCCSLRCKLRIGGACTCSLTCPPIFMAST